VRPPYSTFLGAATQNVIGSKTIYTVPAGHRAVVLSADGFSSPGAGNEALLEDGAGNVWVRWEAGSNRAGHSWSGHQVFNELDTIRIVTDTTLFWIVRLSGYLLTLS
jgi:hypothetical protein